ncbi:MAG: amidohydrolase family protein [Planctomycetes bacterium]|nr:amidohydrolase family protein [Planctomycetota bacterium]
MGYIDAHVHVWSDDRARYPHTPGADVGHMDLPRFNGDDVTAMMAPHGFDRAVLVQSSWYGEDHRCLTDTIAVFPGKFRGIAAIDPEARDVAGRMRELAKAGVRGFRIVHLNPVDLRKFELPGVAEMFRCAADDGLVICPLMDVAALPGLSAMCERFPRTRVVIDHMCRIGAVGAVKQGDVAALTAMAGHANVFVKVSGFWALGKAAPPYDDLATLIRSLRDAFGAGRLMWASDGPYGMTRGSYADAVGLVRDRLVFLSEAERGKILEETAERVFFGG